MRKNVLIFIICLIFFCCKLFAVNGAFFTEEIQGRIMQMKELPLVFANINGIGYALGDENLKIAPTISILATGMMVSIEDIESRTKTSNFAWGFGAAVGLRIVFINLLSVKPEFSYIQVSTQDKNIAIMELGVDMGFCFGQGKPFDITFDFIRVGVRPSEITNPWIPDMKGPFYITSYPTIGFRYYFW